MKTIILRIALALLMLAAYGSTAMLVKADSVPAPMCWPNPCQPQ